MKARWWGEPWPSEEAPATVCDNERFRISAPVGERCVWCDEVIDYPDQGLTMPEMMLRYGQPVGELVHVHRECQVRSFVGSLAHLERRCHCYGGVDHDTPGLSRRQEALAVERWLYEHGCED